MARAGHDHHLIYHTMGRVNLVLYGVCSPFFFLLFFFRNAPVFNSACLQQNSAPRPYVLPGLDGEPIISLDAYFRKGHIDRSAWVYSDDAPEGHPTQPDEVDTSDVEEVSASELYIDRSAQNISDLEGGEQQSASNSV